MSFSTESAIVCTLESPWAAGSWLPDVRDANGQVPIDPSVAPHILALRITDFSPTILNVAGGDIVTVTGENFPVMLSKFPGFAFQWSDGSKCVVLESTSSWARCRNVAFSEEVRDEVIAARDGRRRL